MSLIHSDFVLLIEAVKSTDSSNVREALDQCEKKNLPITVMLSTMDRLGYSPIHYAVCQENLDVLQQLLAHADEKCVNFRSKDWLTPIWLLLSKNFFPSAEEMLVSLLEAKANPNWLLYSRTRYRCPDHTNLPLVYALQTGRWRMAEILLEGGANPQCSSCICYAIDFTLENPELLLRFLDRGCYHPHLLSVVLTRDYEGRCEQTVLDLCNIILPYHDNCSKFDFGVICDAATSGYFEVLVLLLMSLRPGINLPSPGNNLPSPGNNLPSPGNVAATINEISRLLTRENYRRFLTAYFRFLEVRNYVGAPYLFLLYTARKAQIACCRHGRRAAGLHQRLVPQLVSNS